MSTPETVHDRIRHSTAELAPRLWDVAQELHRHPELAFEEHRSAALLSKELESEGFTVERGVAGLETAFTARTGNGDGPCVALLLEYDALPGLGHACGHNLIAGAGLGAALALRGALPEIGGTLLVVGTPAEETGGGKAIQVEAGVFDDVDAALMFHPGVYSWSSAPLTAQVQLRVGFHGRAAHPTGNPTEGLDASPHSSSCSTPLPQLGVDCPRAPTSKGSSPRGAGPRTSCRSTRRAASGSVG